jgi:pectate lyase
MFMPGLARALAYVLSIGFLIGVATAAVPPAAEPGRETLPPNDGWGSVPTAALPQGTTGGSAATRTATVTNRKELLAALAWPDASPKLIYVKGTIDMNVDDAGISLNCKDYYRADPATGEMYSPFAFLAMYDPAGPLAKDKKPPFVGQEDARAASHAAQEARVHVRVPANTTLFGLEGATLIGAWLHIEPAIDGGDHPINQPMNQPMNVIVRNLNIEDTADCFPEWSPTDGATGNWNAAYDSVSIRHSTHVWIDHNRFADARTRDESQPTWFGHVHQVHDGLLDITDESDYVTVSWNRFVSHDKAVLIGGSDDAAADAGKLRVTLHHNLFENVGQRMPRVRFGQVHVYGNLYKINGKTNYRSSWGVGFESHLYAENNYFDLSAGFGAMEAIDGKKGAGLTAVGNCWTLQGVCEPTDFVAAWNAKFDPDLKADAGWKPTLYGDAPGAEPADFARQRILSESGPGAPLRKK